MRNNKNILKSAILQDDVNVSNWVDNIWCNNIIYWRNIIRTDVGIDFILKKIMHTSKLLSQIKYISSFLINLNNTYR